MYRVGNRRHIPRSQKKLLLTIAARTSTKNAAYLTGMSARTVRRVKRLQALTGDVVSHNPLARRRRILDRADITYLLGQLDRQPDLTLAELSDTLQSTQGAFVSGSTIARALRQQCFSRKQLTRVALEASAEARAQYIAVIGEYESNQLVCVDETAVNRHTVRRSFGYATVGTRAYRLENFVRGERYTVVAGLSLDGIRHLDVFPCSATANLFILFVQRLLEVMNPWPLPNSVIVLDNAAIHYSAEVEEMVANKGCRLVYLPAYSPDLNPIEEFFSSFKAALRRQRNRALAIMNGACAHNQDVYGLLWELVFQATPEMAAGWFRHCGYV